jgi:hypothetical protein
MIIWWLQCDLLWGHGKGCCTVADHNLYVCAQSVKFVLCHPKVSIKLVGFFFWKSRMLRKRMRWDPIRISCNFYCFCIFFFAWHIFTFKNLLISYLICISVINLILFWNLWIFWHDILIGSQRILFLNILDFQTQINKE